MAEFGEQSRSRLYTLHPELQAVLNVMIKKFDFKIISGHRGEEEQNALFNARPQRSKKKWPESKHNTEPSDGVDIAPFPIDWTDSRRFCYLAGRVMETADRLGIRLRWGGDWDMDTEIKDHRFSDLGHFERR
jgi:peptidoglycan L-alanyl-D-glutamate endopeptidase CwlK